MKKIVCEYCRSQIDISKEDNCPSYGADFFNNNEYIKIKEQMHKSSEVKLRERKFEL